MKAYSVIFVFAFSVSAFAGNFMSKPMQQETCPNANQVQPITQNRHFSPPNSGLSYDIHSTLGDVDASWIKDLANQVTPTGLFAGVTINQNYKLQCIYLFLEPQNQMEATMLHPRDKSCKPDSLSQDWISKSNGNFECGGPNTVDCAFYCR